MTLTTDEFNGFTINLFQDEDGDWIAHLVEMPNISAFADTPQAALTELTLAWEGVKESYRKHREEIPHLVPKDFNTTIQHPPLTLATAPPTNP